MPVSVDAASVSARRACYQTYGILQERIRETSMWRRSLGFNIYCQLNTLPRSSLNDHEEEYRLECAAWVQLILPSMPAGSNLEQWTEQNLEWGHPGDPSRLARIEMPDEGHNFADGVALPAPLKIGSKTAYYLLVDEDGETILPYGATGNDATSKYTNKDGSRSVEAKIYRCMLCGTYYSRPKTVKDHFGDCAKRGNPNNYAWNSHVTCRN